MDDGMRPYEELLRDVGRQSDEETQASARTTARSAANEAVARWEAQRSRSWRVPATRAVFAFAAAAALAVVLFVVTKGRSSDALSFMVGDAGEHGKVGAWMASPPAGLPLRFSEGTQIVLQAGASARVTHADAHGADLLLERGALRANVVHRDEATGWMVHAGPFEIHIVGTSFDTSWDPAEGALDVGVTEGRVIVTGPLLDEGRAVASEERLRISLKSSRFEMTKTATPFTVPSDSPKAAGGAANEDAPPTIAPTADPQAPKLPEAPAGSTTSAASGNAAPHASGSASGVAVNGWRDLARAGQHKAALDAAMSLGFGRVLGESSGADLLLLADSARYAGDSGHAKQALVAARGRGEKGRTAFLLGKIAADSSGAPGEAAQWFEAYLAEAPGGALAEQALGRLIELYRRTGRTGEARSAATNYIEKYPGGGYAGAARSVLGEP